MEKGEVGGLGTYTVNTNRGEDGARDRRRITRIVDRAGDDLVTGFEEGAYYGEDDYGEEGDYCAARPDFTLASSFV